MITARPKRESHLRDQVKAELSRCNAYLEACPFVMGFVATFALFAFIAECNGVDKAEQARWALIALCGALQLLRRPVSHQARRLARELDELAD